MMAILNFTLLLILAFVIFASISCVEGLKCFTCGPVDNSVCSGESFECPANGICYTSTHKDGGTSSMESCKVQSAKVNETVGCRNQEIFGTPFHVCYCNTDNCNKDSQVSQDPKIEDSTTPKDSGDSSQASSFSLSIIVCVIAGAAFYQNQ